MDPFVALMRRYVIDYTNRQDTSVCADIMEPGYTLRMGSHVLAGRDEAYLPAVAKQFTQFPGLCLTVHEIVTDGNRLAMRFSEHGGSARHGGATASWTGIGLYRWNGRRLLDNWVEQDYEARRRQLATGVPDSVARPDIAPWDTVPVPGDPSTERTVRAWIDAGLPGAAVRWDDGDTSPLLEDVTERVDDMFTAGDRAVFRLTRTGRYVGGLDGVPHHGRQATLTLVGVVRVAGGEVVAGNGVRDRLGMARALAANAA